MIIYSKELKISDNFKKKLESTVGTTNTDITYIPGGLIEINKTNIDYINPNKIIIKKNQKEILILSYGNYYEEENAIFLYDINNKCTWTKLKELLS